MKYNDVNKNTKWLQMAIVLAYFVIAARNLSMFPYVFADEWVHMHYALSDNPDYLLRPQYFYFAIYRLSRFFGDSYYIFAKALNLFFFAGYLFCVFKFCRLLGLVLNDSLFVVLVAVLYPSNIESAFFMSESLYSFLFGILVVCFLWNLDFQNKFISLLIGVILALMVNVKPHAYTLLFSFILIYFFQSNYVWSERLKRVILLLGAFFIVNKLILFFYMSESTKLSGNHLEILPSLSQILKNKYFYLQSSLFIFWGHISNILVIMFAPLIIIFISFRSGGKYKDTQKKVLVLLTFFTVTILLFISVYNALTAESGPYESILRLSSRYYQFIYPFIFGLAVLNFKDFNERDRKFSRIIFFIVIVWISSFVLQSRLPALVDNPFFTIAKHYVNFSVLAAISTLFLIFYVAVADNIRKQFFYVYYFFFLVAFNIGLFHYLRPSFYPSYIDKASIITKLLVKDSTKTVFIAGNDLASLYRFSFGIGKIKNYFVKLPEKETLTKVSYERFDYLALFGLCDLSVEGKTLIDDVDSNNCFKLVELKK